MVSVLEPPLSPQAVAVAPPPAHASATRTAALDAAAPASPLGGGAEAKLTDNVDLDASPPSSSSSDDDSDPDPAAQPAPPPFYDPRADYEDEEYLSRRDIGGRRKAAASGAGAAGAETTARARPLASDAALSCPGCFSELTRWSQRHAEDPAVFRSVFVDDDAVSVVGRADKKGGGGGGKKSAPQGRSSTAASLPPPPGRRNRAGGPDLPRVACAVCEEVVGCLEGDGVFVFFNVLPSA